MFEALRETLEENKLLQRQKKPSLKQTVKLEPVFHRKRFGMPFLTEESVSSLRLMWREALPVFKL